MNSICIKTIIIFIIIIIIINELDWINCMHSDAQLITYKEAIINYFIWKIWNLKSLFLFEQLYRTVLKNSATLLARTVNCLPDLTLFAKKKTKLSNCHQFSTNFIREKFLNTNFFFISIHQPIMVGPYVIVLVVVVVVLYLDQHWSLESNLMNKPFLISVSFVLFWVCIYIYIYI